MYNAITEEKIKRIPSIGDIDIQKLPQELTRIYAQIVSLRRKITGGIEKFRKEDFITTINKLQSLANNLETILLVFPLHEKKESIAFVAATCNNLIYKIGLIKEPSSTDIFESDTISPYISAIILFLIGNSQADASEMALKSFSSDGSNRVKNELAISIQYLAAGNLSKICDKDFSTFVLNGKDEEETALNYLWNALDKGIYNIAAKLSGENIREDAVNVFDKVIDLAKSDGFLDQPSIFSGPYHLARLLKILEEDILTRGVINIQPPNGVDSNSWSLFLKKLSNVRPYLWENHKEAVDSNFLNPGISAILTLPTGAGKSTLSELKIASCIFNGKRVVYIVPTHALEDQVNKNLKELFAGYKLPDLQFGGEFTEIGEPELLSFLVITPERCLTLLNTNPDLFLEVGLVVFDEFHLIHGTNINKDRRSIDAMYCLISLFTLIPNADYLLISAMVENGDQIKGWVESITSRRCELFNSSWKPTRQLHGCLVYDETDIKSLESLIHEEHASTKLRNPSAKLKKALNIDPYCFFSLRNIWETTDSSDYFRTRVIDGKVLLDINNDWNLTSNRNNIAAKLAIHFSELGLKTLIFVDDPRIANSTSQKIEESLKSRTNDYYKFFEEKSSLIKSLVEELGAINHSYFFDHGNVGIHHGLLLPIERNLIEEYFKSKKGSIALVATATLAQGINLPAEVVIIAGDDRFTEGSKYREKVPPHELLNAAGRAGRAGQSSQGAVIVIPGKITTIQQTPETSTISARWWELKQIFSKSDQCLKIEDPLGYFLDSIQDEALKLDTTQINVLYKFKSENLSEYETAKLLKNTFYAYQSNQSNNNETFSDKLEKLMKRRNELDLLSEDIIWTKEISFKTGIDPSLILDLGQAFDKENLQAMINLSIIDLIDWFFDWLNSNNTILSRVFTKTSTIAQIKRVVGFKASEEVEEIKIIMKLPILKEILKLYVQGKNFEEIDDAIPESSPKDKNQHLTKARNFVIKLIPDISFSFGLLSMIIIEKAKQLDIQDGELPWNIRALSSCIKEGFDDSKKLFYKLKHPSLLRVQVHKNYTER